jgi:hypothetical protein
MENAMTPLGAVLASISIDHRWGHVKLSVVSIVGHFPEGCEVSNRTLGHLAVAGGGWISEAVKQLVEDQVLEVVELPAGSRPGKYRLNPDVTRWRNVPWRGKGPMRQRADAVAWRVHLAAEMFHVEQPQDTNEGVVLRPYDGARAPFVHRPLGRSTNGKRKEVVLRHRKRSQGAALRAVLERSANEQAAVESLYEERAKSSESPRADENSLSNEPEGIHQAARELAAAVGARGVWGRPRSDLARLIEDHGLRNVLAGITATDPTGMQVPSMVAAVADRLRGFEDGGGEDPHEAAERRAANLRTMIDLYDDDDPKRAQLLEELQNLESVTGTCHNEHQEVAE